MVDFIITPEYPDGISFLLFAEPLMQIITRLSLCCSSDFLWYCNYYYRDNNSSWN